MRKLSRAIDRLFDDPGITYMLAGAFLVAAISFFGQRGVAARTPVGQAVAPYDATWNGLYLLAAVLIVGSFIARLRQATPAGYPIDKRRNSDKPWEGAGLVALSGGLLLNMITALCVQGVTDIRSYVYLPLIAGAWGRLTRVVWE